MRREKAIHEAGHAVVGLVLGFRPTIEINDNDKDFWAHTFLKAWLPKPLDSAMTYIAGHVAEWIDSDEGGELLDYLESAEVNETSWPSTQACDFEGAWTNLAQSCGLSTNKDRQLSNRELTKLQAAWVRLAGDTQRLLEEHWLLVELVAEELLATGKVSSERIDELAANLAG
ncbi:MAG: hypothetical protein ACLPUG_06260 [Acidimicrobiales bacterium]